MLYINIDCQFHANRQDPFAMVALDMAMKYNNKPMQDKQHGRFMDAQGRCP